MLRKVDDAIKMFEDAGFRVVHMVKDDFYLLVPSSSEEHELHGHPCISARAVQKIQDYIVRKKHDLLGML
jgi:hypothetical protein